MMSVGIDYDGDGNTSEGIYDELVGLRDKLARRSDVCSSTARRSATPPTATRTGSSTATATAAARPRRRPQRVRELDPRPLRATYNYQMASRIRAFAHNAKYIIELLYDRSPTSTARCGQGRHEQGDRTDFGHFNGASEAARHWDQNDRSTRPALVPRGGRLPLLRASTTWPGGPGDCQRPECGTCHDKPGTDFSRRSSRCPR
jgi:hypothetical protein